MPRRVLELQRQGHPARPRGKQGREASVVAGPVGRDPRERRAQARAESNQWSEQPKERAGRVACIGAEDARSEQLDAEPEPRRRPRRPGCRLVR